MCLGIPGKVLERFEKDSLPMGKVDFDGITKEICLNLTPEVEVGQYVLVHVGFALNVIDEEEAQELFAYLREIEELNDQDQTPLQMTPEPPTASDAEAAS